MKFIFSIYLLGVLSFIGVAGCTPTQKQLQLLEASKKADTTTVRSLLAHGADVNAKANDGGSALMVAEKRDCAKIIRLLKRAGAK